MKLKLIALTAVICLTAVSCGEKKENSYSSPKVSESSMVNSIETQNDVAEITDSKKAMEEKFKDVPDADEGALISISDTTAKAGEIAEVTVSVKGVDLKWNMCGIHLTYPEELSCIYRENDNKNLKFKSGKASEHNSGIIAMEWKKENNPPEELVKQNLGSLFFTATFDGNEGQDGDIITLYLKIPENAESGTVYPIGFYYMNTDIFSNAESDPSFEKYAFEHIQTGSITVE